MKRLEELEKGQAELKRYLRARTMLVLSDIDSDAFHQTILQEFKIGISSWSESLTQSLVTAAGTVHAPVSSPPPASDPPAFEWSHEPKDQQHERYMQYLRDHLTLPPRRQFQLIRPTNDTLLSVINNPYLPFDLKGTADALVVHKGYLREFPSKLGIFLVIQVKKECDAKAVRQSIAQLIAADLLSDLRRSPFAMLTDLREEWHFYWLEGRTVQALRPTGATSRRDRVRNHTNH